MTFYDFIKDKGATLISVIFIIDFSFTSWFWIFLSPAVSEIVKVEYVSKMMIFCLLPWFIPVMFKLQQFLRKESGKKAYSKDILDKQKQITTIFTFLYNILVFSLTRVMDFLEFSIQSYFALQLIFVISITIIIVFFFYGIETKYKKLELTIALLMLYLIVILGFFL